VAFSDGGLYAVAHPTSSSTAANSSDDAL